jgi:hypothetical protein
MKMKKLMTIAVFVSLLLASNLSAKANAELKAKRAEIFQKVKSMGLSDIDKLKSCINSSSNLKELRSCRKSSRGRMKEIRNYLKGENAKIKAERKKRKEARAKRKAEKQK